MLLFVALLFIGSLGHTHECIHDQLDQMGLRGQIHQPIDHDAMNGIKRDVHQTFPSNWQPMRVTVDWDVGASTWGNTAFKNWIQTTILPQALDFFEGAFKVHRNSGNFILAKPCATYYTNPYRYLSFLKPFRDGCHLLIPFWF
jgi:hypothetical protein